MTANDLADKDVTDCSMVLLLGDPSKLPPLDLSEIHGLEKSFSLRRYQEVIFLLLFFASFLSHFFI